MHAVFVTFRPQGTEEEIMAAFGAKMHDAMFKTAGLIMKTFIEDGPQTWGSFYLFESPETAHAYLEGDFFTEFSGSPLIADVEARHLAVDDGPSKAFGTPSVPLSQTTAA